MTDLELREVTRDYHIGRQRVRALDRLTLSVRSGEFIAIVGPSGAGKSTLLHLLGGLDRPTQGSVVVDGVDLTSLRDEELASFRRTRVGFLFQFFNLLPLLSAWENVAIPRLLGGDRLSHARKDALDMLGLVGLADRESHRPAELSGGQMQRVALARALIMDPAVVLADEPTGNLDSKTGAEILDLLAGIARNACAVVMVTHNAAAAERAGRTVRLADGRVAENRSNTKPGHAS